MSSPSTTGAAQGGSTLNPGHTSQFGGALGTMSNFLGGFGNAMNASFGLNGANNSWGKPMFQRPATPSTPVQTSPTVQVANLTEADNTFKPTADENGFIDARPTVYTGQEKDGFGSTTARPGASGKSIAIEGDTVAVDPALIPFGSRIQVIEAKTGKPFLFGGNTSGIYTAHDTGSAVKSRKATGGSKSVLDFFAQSGDPIALNAQAGYNVKYKILPSGAVTSPAASSPKNQNIFKNPNQAWEQSIMENPYFQGRTDL